LPTAFHRVRSDGIHAAETLAVSFTDFIYPPLALAQLRARYTRRLRPLYYPSMNFPPPAAASPTRSQPSRSAAI
jgi:hypothetical protein